MRVVTDSRRLTHTTFLPQHQSALVLGTKQNPTNPPKQFRYLANVSLPQHQNQVYQFAHTPSLLTCYENDMGTLVRIV